MSNECSGCGIDTTLEEKTGLCNIDQKWSAPYRDCKHISFCGKCHMCCEGRQNGTVHLAINDRMGCCCHTCAALHLKKCHKEECTICVHHRKTLLNPPPVNDPAKDDRESFFNALSQVFCSEQLEKLEQLWNKFENKVKKGLPLEDHGRFSVYPRVKKLLFNHLWEEEVKTTGLHLTGVFKGDFVDTLKSSLAFNVGGYCDYEPDVSWFEEP